MTDSKTTSSHDAARVDPTNLTLDQAAERFERVHLAGRNLAATTRVEYLADLRDFTAFLKGSGIERVTVVAPAHLAGFLAELDRRKLKGSTRQRKATTLRIFFRFLVHQHYLLASPADELVPPAKETALPRFLSEAEYKRLLAAARHEPRDLAIIELLLQTGIRRLELVNLLLSDVQLPEKMPRGEKVLGQRAQGATHHAQRPGLPGAAELPRRPSPGGRSAPLPVEVQARPRLVGRRGRGEEVSGDRGDRGRERPCPAPHLRHPARPAQDRAAGGAGGDGAREPGDHLAVRRIGARTD